MNNRDALLALTRLPSLIVGRIMYRINNLVVPLVLAECGEGLAVAHPFTLRGAAATRFGNDVSISSGAYIRADGGLTIGDHFRCGPNMTILTVNHDYRGGVPYGKKRIFKPVTIGDRVWVGANVTIVPGTTIGACAVIGAGATVAGVVGSGAIVASAKVRVINRRTDTKSISQGDE